MAYADYGYYTGTFLGNAIAEDDFPRLALRASERIDALTRGRAEAFFAHTPDPISKAACAVAEAIQRTERAGAAVHQERMDKYSVTYAAQNAQEQRSAEIAAAAQYLAATGLLYAGVPIRGW